ncbi:FAD-dependent monooxygenase, putative [Plasmodium ovale curtisi]|uniref:FAD-dependent monooxygenase, putative n=1 Tax=Plasmodium ovale curtisi TaxID=864141 RepID=A0A1A8WYS5_PLAOA|nr:FAD-dependent monooxygenase, putative [Plasmodium ovale curtisi]
MKGAKVRRTFVLIVGGGPTGVTTGLYLQKYGIPHILIEKNKHLEKLPKAHYYNNQTMEAWRHIYHLDKCILNETENLKLWKTFQYCLNIRKNKTICTYNNFTNKYTYMDTYYEDISPSKVTHLSQYKLLGILYSHYLNKVKCDSVHKREFLKRIPLKLSTQRILKKILNNSKDPRNTKHKVELSRDDKQEEVGKEDDSVYENFFSYDPSEMLIGHEFVNFVDVNDVTKSGKFWEKNNNPKMEYNDFTRNEDTDNMDYARSSDTERSNCVITKIKNLANDEEELILSNYVFVCEGGKSSIKKVLHINDEYKKDYMKFVNIHFCSVYLSKLVKYNPSMLYFIFNKYIGVLVCHNYKQGDFVLHIPYITEKELEMYSNRYKCLEIINTLIDFPIYDINIHNIYKWTMHSSLASTFVDKKTKSIILLGDSAHKLPPSGGFGLNLGIGDVLNITWKIIRIFNFKKNIFLKNVKKRDMLNSGYTKNDFTSYIINEIKKENESFKILNRYDKKKIDNYIESYNLERKLVANFTIYHAVKNYEKGNNIPCILGYNHHFFAKWINRICNNFIQRSFLFYYFFKNAKLLLHFFNNIPYIFEFNKRKAEILLQKQENILTLLYPGVDSFYSYINTIENIYEEETFGVDKNLSKKNHHRNGEEGENTNRDKKEISNWGKKKNSTKGTQKDWETGIHRMEVPSSLSLQNAMYSEKVGINSIGVNHCEHLKRGTYEEGRHFDKHSNPFDEHSSPFDEHSSPFDEHSSPFDEHSSPFDEHSSPFDEHSSPFELRGDPLHKDGKNVCANFSIFEEKKENVPKLKVCKNIYEHQITHVNGTKIPHFHVYTFGKKYIYKLSTIDLPIWNNPCLSILVILFDSTMLNKLISFLSINSISRDKFSFCFWDSDVLIYLGEKNQSINIVKQDNIKSIDENICRKGSSITMNYYSLFSNEENDLMTSNALAIKHLQIHEEKYNINYIFTSKLILDMFLRVLKLQSRNAFVIVRPDKHIISAGDNNLLEHIKNINKIYI